MSSRGRSRPPLFPYTTLFRSKTQGAILANVDQAAQVSQRMLLAEAVPAVEGIVADLKTHASVERIDAAGSYRRRKETVGDRKSTRLNSSHGYISYAVFCLKKK